MTTMATKTKPTMKKLPAVRLAVKALGGDSPVKEVRKWVKTRYNLDLTDATAQNYVYQARKEAKEANGTPAKMQPPKAAPAPIKAHATPTSAPIQAPSKPTPAAPKATSNGVGIEQLVEAITTLKKLVSKLGKDNLLKLLEAL
jgi:hypothetical protein